MCKEGTTTTGTKTTTTTTTPPISSSTTTIATMSNGSRASGMTMTKAPPQMPPRQPTVIEKYTALSILVGCFSLWSKHTFLPEETSTPTIHIPLHSYRIPLAFTTGYLVSLPLLKYIVSKYLIERIDMKALLQPCMIFYNTAQVMINLWMVYRFIKAVTLDGQPFSGSIGDTTSIYVVWVHYTNKYLEFLDTVFMVLRGRMDQVSFLHVYHHTTIAWAWWIAMLYFPGGDAYFGALLNSTIHVLMYSYYALSLLKIPCPWKRFLTQAQLLQFATVILYTMYSCPSWPKNEVGGQHYFAMAIQIWEMSSLFLLFMVFYRKSYSKAAAAKKKKSKVKAKSGMDQEESSSSSSAGVGITKPPKSKNKGGASSSITKAATKALDAATEDANKIFSSATNVPTVKNVLRASEVPSWSIVN